MLRSQKLTVVAGIDSSLNVSQKSVLLGVMGDGGLITQQDDTHEKQRSKITRANCRI
jgi:hypothetical protein